MKREMIKYISRLVALAMVLLASCIKNDIPYPLIELEITKVSGEGFTQKSIDVANRVIYITLDESTDIQNVNIEDVEYTEGAELSNDIIGKFDMRKPLYTTLSLYQSYDWTIRAEQTITREFKVAGQIGEERINAEQLTVDVDVNMYSVDFKSVEVTAMKLAGEGVTTYDPTIEELSSMDFNSDIKVDVTSHGRWETWSIYLHKVEPSVDLSVVAWGTIAWLTATGDTTDPSKCSFAYRKVGDEAWQTIAASSTNNGTFEVKVTALEPESEYEFEAFSGELSSGERVATTESTPQLPNSNFEEWQQIGNPWFPYLGETIEEFWGTGNKGSTLLSANSNITLPDYADIAPGSDGLCSTKMVSSSVIGVFAAGNIFTGRFVKIAGTNGIIGMGRPFTSRPTGLRGWAKFVQGMVTHADESKKLDKGDMDQGSIYIALGTWDAATYGKDSTGEILGDATTPIIIDTRSKSTFFDKTSADIIAYQELIFDADQDWSEFELELEYRDLVDANGNVIEKAQSRIPTHILIVCSSSRYGDYFTGSTSSRMWVDDFELIYE